MENVSINGKIINMINKHKSVNEIAEAVNLSNKQLFYRLKLLEAKGYEFGKKYYYNGDIVYDINKRLTNSNFNNSAAIYSKLSDNEFKAMFISDLHLGSNKDRVDLLKVIYDYCAKENINIIINAGDFIDGLIGNQSKKYFNIEEQINYAIKNHPFDKNILNFLCLGNHDYDSYEKSGQDLAKALNSRRHDIVPIGYGNGLIKIKNEEIIVIHPGTKSLNSDYDPRYKLILSGHHHTMKFLTGYNNSLQIQIPSLSDLLFRDYNIMAGAVKARITFNNGFFETGVFTNLLVEKTKIHTCAELQSYLLTGKNCHNDNINYIDNRNIEKTTSKIITDNQESEKPKVKRLSQIEKFNNRYNK